MRSLSMPDNLFQLAQDIQAMELRVGSSKERRRRSGSDEFAFMDEDVLENSTPNVRSNGQNKTSFLPNNFVDDDVDSLGLSFGERDTVIPEIPEIPSTLEEDEEFCHSHHQNQPETTIDKTCAQAAAFVDELLSVVGVPTSSSNYASPTSVRTVQTVASAFPKATQNGDDEPLPRTPATQWFGTTSATSFRMLRDRRSLSLSPNMVRPLPRKSSMKRISSISSSSEHSSQQQPLKRGVSFSNLEIREYSIALSDHPSCSFGPPIQLGWEYEQIEKKTVEEYEQSRSPRRSMAELVMSYNVRRYLLLKRAGYSKHELQEAMREVHRVKRGRLVTDLFLPASKIDETFEDVVDGIKNVLFPKQRAPRL